MMMFRWPCTLWPCVEASTRYQRQLRSSLQTLQACHLGKLFEVRRSGRWRLLHDITFFVFRLEESGGCNFHVKLGGRRKWHRFWFWVQIYLNCEGWCLFMQSGVDLWCLNFWAWIIQNFSLTWSFLINDIFLWWFWSCGTTTSSAQLCFCIFNQFISIATCQKWERLLFRWSYISWLLVFSQFCCEIFRSYLNYLRRFDAKFFWSDINPWQFSVNRLLLYLFNFRGTFQRTN